MAEEDQRDRVIGNWAPAHIAAVANRQRMFNDLLDTPVRRDLTALLTRKMRALRIARTYTLTDAYPMTLTALKTMASYCRQQGIALVMVVMPYDYAIDSIPYKPEDVARFIEDLHRIAADYGARVLDQGRAVGHDCFGLYTDGSAPSWTGCSPRPPGTARLRSCWRCTPTPPRFAAISAATPTSEPRLTKAGNVVLMDAASNTRRSMPRLSHC